MPVLRPQFVALCIVTAIAPFVFYTIKFTRIEPKSMTRVEFDLNACYVCRDCPCEFDINRKEKYILNKHDKTLCKVGYEVINEGKRKNIKYMQVDMEKDKFAEFYDCVKWYAKFPSIVN